MGAFYYYGQDGEIVDNQIKHLFELDEKELRWSNEKNASVYGIVGFVFKEDKTLVVFPKHYYNESDIERFNSLHVELSGDIQLLYRVIKKYSESPTTRAMADSYIGYEEGYDSDYPFKPFYEIYNYFQHYGLFMETQEKIVKGSTGKISWKNTLEKAQKIISDGNLIFSPLYSKKKNLNSAFITECMAFVIDYTIEQFHSFLTLRKTGYRQKQFDYFKNDEYVIAQLNQYKSIVFKDIHKKLIQSLIDFFEQYKRRTKTVGGKIHVKIHYFDMIWQKMIDVYINQHFVGMDASGDNAIFDLTQTVSPVIFSAQVYNDIDDSTNHFFINIDHVAFTGSILYIFDSKYYFDVDSLNYKQFSYNEILRYYYSGVTAIYNMLILPGDKSSKLHFSLSPSYAGSRVIGTKIIEQYLPTKEVMENYVETD